MKISVKAPAKINLTLDVLHKRIDGYHEIEMVMTTIDLADRIELTTTDENVITVESSGGFVPSDSRNLAHQAADLLRRKFGRKDGVHIYIDKQIPVSAGLAGGSSDAAATLKGLNELWSLDLSTEQLAKLGAEIGSDVSFCVYGGTAVAKGRGEIIKPISCPPPCWIVLAKPTIGVSTADVYRQLKLDNVNHPDTRKMISAIERKDYRQINRTLQNVLESVTLQQYPEVRHIKEQMERLGADGVLMSGSGPTVFGLTMYETRAKSIYNGLRGFCNEVFMVRMLGESE
ncbi:4-(cytidine 5'-diphospho)-2-C-methyl-D-erythritol kinase [Pseudalkalibacillus decolorationis]|uniref:4-(cytidine 5'-diphospho)-2-C-methyl-D-erythritol kinase n=1 Tax=Pseudalkalibacillus decolorationis TaxID=163879 RepID=UPI0021481550|nr:4-(cytidine 5'-diphospho)-2-C-methyl-D-erythritol kinase [Pseudalkalibacillus decolorationis]